MVPGPLGSSGSLALSPDASGMRGLRAYRPASGYRGRSSVRFSIKSVSLSVHEAGLTVARGTGATWALQGRWEGLHLERIRGWEEGETGVPRF